MALPVREDLSDNIKSVIKERGRFYLYKGKDGYFYVTRYGKNTKWKEPIRRTTDQYVNHDDAQDILRPYGGFVAGKDYRYDRTDEKRYTFK